MKRKLSFLFLTGYYIIFLYLTLIKIHFTGIDITEAGFFNANWVELLIALVFLIISLVLKSLSDRGGK